MHDLLGISFHRLPLPDDDDAAATAGVDMDNGRSVSASQSLLLARPGL